MPSVTPGLPWRLHGKSDEVTSNTDCRACGVIPAQADRRAVETSSPRPPVDRPERKDDESCWTTVRFSAARFRQLADQYEKIANPLEQSCTAIDENAGKLTIAAFHRGYLSDVPSLGDLVEWVENPPSPFPLDPQAKSAPCASNLFRELCGNHIIPGKKQPEGYWRIHSDRTHGGIMPSVFPDILPGLKYCVPGEDIERRKQRSFSSVDGWPQRSNRLYKSCQRPPPTTNATSGGMD